MPGYLGYRPNRYTLTLSRGAAFMQCFEVIGSELPNGTTAWIDFYDTTGELLTTWQATTVTTSAVEFLIEPRRIDALANSTHIVYNLYLDYPDSALPYCWFRGPIAREQ